MLFWETIISGKYKRNCFFLTLKFHLLEYNGGWYSYTYSYIAIENNPFKSSSKDSFAAGKDFAGEFIVGAEPWNLIPLWLLPRITCTFAFHLFSSVSYSSCLFRSVTRLFKMCPGCARYKDDTILFSLWRRIR